MLPLSSPNEWLVGFTEANINTERNRITNPAENLRCSRCTVLWIDRPIYTQRYSKPWYYCATCLFSGEHWRA